jgi:hypothetical protein
MKIAQYSVICCPEQDCGMHLRATGTPAFHTTVDSSHGWFTGSLTTELQCKAYCEQAALGNSGSQGVAQCTPPA